MTEPGTAKRGLGRRRSAAHVPAAEVIEKERRVLELRRAGHDFGSIAAQVGYSNKSAAHKAYTRALARTLQPDADELRELWADRLEALLTMVWAQARDGDLQAVDRVLKIGDREAALLGLDAAHGLAERSQALAEAQGQMLAGGIAWLLAQLGALLGHPDLERDERVRALVETMFLSLDAGKPPAVGSSAAGSTS